MVQHILFLALAIVVVLYVRYGYTELSERVEHNRTEANTRIDARVFKSDFEREVLKNERLICDLIKRVDELEKEEFKLVRKDEDEDDDEKDDDDDDVTAENAEVALDYDSVNITVG